MKRLSTEQRTRIVAALVEGNSIRSTCRMTGAAKGTVTKLLVDLGTACSVHMDHDLRDLPCQRLQVDEIWTFVGQKQKNVPMDRQADKDIGDVWTWVAIDADTKLVPSYRVGARDLQEARMLMADLAGRLRHRVQLTTDGFRPYIYAVEDAFPGGIDYAQLVKIYGGDPKVNKKASTRYSPAICLGMSAKKISGDPDPQDVSTSLSART